MAIKILALVGSLRSASINRQIAELASAVAGEDVVVTVFEGLGELPFYNEEIDDAMTSDAPTLAPVAALRAAAADADAALVVTPSTTAASRRSSRMRSTGCPARSATAH